jgi:hypothetical protein
MALSAAAVLENVNKQIVQMFFKADVTQRGGRHREPNRRPTNNAPAGLTATACLSGSVAAAFSI